MIKFALGKLQPSQEAWVISKRGTKDIPNVTQTGVP